MMTDLTVLVIEDDVDLLKNLQDILQLDGCAVLGANCFEQAFDLVSDQEVLFVLADRRLPDGLIEDRIGDLRSACGNVEVIVMTGYGDMESTIVAFKNGVSDYLIKPILPETVRNLVRKATEQRELKREAQRERELSDSILGTAEAIMLLLDLDGCVVRFNPFFSELCGWTMDDLVAKCWFDYCIAADRREQVERVFEETARESKTRGVVNEVIGKDGGRHLIRWSNTLLEHGGREAPLILAVGVDITDLDAAQKRALQAERLAAIGQTVTALAHESRNALQRIRAAGELLEVFACGDEDALEEVLTISNATRELHLLHEELRSFAAPIQLEPMPTTLPELWRAVWHDLGSVQTGRNASLVETDCQCDLATDVDPIRMKQVFRNLFENSLSATDGPVTVRVQCLCSSELVDLRVIDDGPGMSDEQRERLFEPFFTTKSTGTGLGMAISRRIVEAHQGTIDAEPVPLGASIRIRLPRQFRKVLKTNCDSSRFDEVCEA